ncbi:MULTISPECIES: RicAFT regulatory complex protein RicA family protein [unclassified Sporolactobacillus]|uniref:RicAFT regulatory complex protein RicA family protein n=1 Tax=unclassified Sporolactobacillus TaxID=2628533 RepID=UPI0023677F63|nr:YlbF family regulator [Sporolactobacillus sp. CQH2019]MDD9146982.1 YlbF family regulator [Sporolactobacillus sp. CQH2019]
MNKSYSTEDILARARKIADHLASAEPIRFYKQAETKISANQKVQRLIDEIKKLQKESVNLQHFQKHEAYRQNEEKIDRLQAELNAIPVVQEFRQSQEDVNDFLQLMVNLMSKRIGGEAQQTETRKPE